MLLKINSSQIYLNLKGNKWMCLRSEVNRTIIFQTTADHGVSSPDFKYISRMYLLFDKKHVNEILKKYRFIVGSVLIGFSYARYVAVFL